MKKHRRRESITGSINELDFLEGELWFIICYYYIFLFQLSVINALTCKYYFKVILSSYLCIWFHFSPRLLSCYTMSTTCDHFTASVKHVRACWCACVCQRICILEKKTRRLYHKDYDAFCGRKNKNTVAFSGSYHIDMLKCELFPHTASLIKSSRALPAIAPPRLSGSACRQHWYGAAVPQHSDGATNIKKERKKNDTVTAVCAELFWQTRVCVFVWACTIALERQTANEWVNDSDLRPRLCWERLQSCSQSVRAGLRVECFFCPTK